MASTFTTNLRLELQGSGENRASWGSRANNVFTLTEEAIAGKSEITVPDVASPDYELTHLNGQTDEARKMFLRFNGALTADRTIVVPSVSKTYVINNNTTGGKNLIVKAAGGANTITLAPTMWKFVYTDGTNVYTNDNFVTFSSATQRWGITAVVDATGRMEIGRYVDFHNANADASDYASRLDTGNTTTDLYITASTGPTAGIGGKVWNAQNMGHGSGMNADLLDGKHAGEIFTEPPDDGKLYVRKVSSGVPSWVAIDAPWTIDAGTGEVTLKFAGNTVIRITTAGLIKTESDVEIFSTTVG